MFYLTAGYNISESMHTLNEGTQEELGITTTHGYDDHSDGGYGLEAPSAAHSGFISESEFYSSPQQPATHHHQPHPHHHPHPHNPHHLTHQHHHALHSMQEVKFHPLQPQHHSPSPASTASSPYNNNNNNNTNGTSNGSSKSAAFLSRGWYNVFFTP